MRFQKSVAQSTYIFSVDHPSNFCVEETVELQDILGGMIVFCMMIVEGRLGSRALMLNVIDEGNTLSVKPRDPALLVQVWASGI